MFFKKIARKIVEQYLAILVGIKLRRMRPKIVAITGSYGKTSTKEAVYYVLKQKLRVYRNQKSLNTEIGLLLAVLEQPSGFSSPAKWMIILVRAFLNAFFGTRYDVLVLEYGADKPGDIENLVKRVPPDIGIITHIARVHQDKAQFESLQSVFEEKKKLVTQLGKKGYALLNYADPLLQKLEGKPRASTLFWSCGTSSPKVGIFADQLKTEKNGFSAAIHYAKKTYEGHFSIPGTYHCDLVLPALLVGTLFDVRIEDGIMALQDFTLPPGRMTIIAGKNESILLDGSYNASPKTVTESLRLLKEYPGERKIAVIGNMNELGSYTQEAHREVAGALGDWLDVLITVGKYARITADEALKNGLSEHKIKTLHTAQEVGELLAGQLHKGDVVLFKGSQNKVRLEHAVKMLMARPGDAKKLLCRQEKEWKDIE